ncbi:MAG: hypothetical protein ACYCWE_09020 [Eubacteriales bacterium]
MSAQNGFHRCILQCARIRSCIRSGIACLFVLQFTELWNGVAEPLVLLETPELYPLAVLLKSNNTPSELAATAVFLIPPLLLYLLFADELSEGLKGCYLK